MQTETGTSYTRLSNLLELELEASKQLKLLLTAEQKAITTHDIPAFEEIIGKKQLILDNLAQYEQARIFLLKSSGMAEAPEGINEYIRTCNDDGRLSDLWQRLLSIATDCRDHNRQNHQLVEVLSTHTRKALRILRGESMEEDMYGPNGGATSRHDNRSLAIA